MNILNRIRYELRQSHSPYGTIVLPKADVLELLRLATDNQTRLDLQTVKTIADLKLQLKHEKEGRTN